MLEERAKQFAESRRSYRLAMSEQCGKLYAPMLLILCGDFVDPQGGAITEGGKILTTLLREHRSNAKCIRTVLLSESDDTAQKIAAACGELLHEPDFEMYHFLCVNYIGDAAHMRIEAMHDAQQAVANAVRGAIQTGNIYWNVHTVLPFPCADIAAASAFLHALETPAQEQTCKRCASYIYGNILNESGRSIVDPQNIYKAIGANLITVDFDASSFNTSVQGHRIVGYAQADIRAERMFKIGFSAFSERLTELLYGQPQQDAELGLFAFGTDTLTSQFFGHLQQVVQTLLRSAQNLCCPKNGMFSKWADISAYETLIDSYFDINLHRLCTPHTGAEMRSVLDEQIRQKCRESGFCLTRQLFEKFAAEMQAARTQWMQSEQALQQAHASQIAQVPDIRSRAVLAFWKRKEYDAVCEAIEQIRQARFFEEREEVFRQIREFNQNLAVSVRNLPNCGEITTRVQIVFHDLLRKDRQPFLLMFENRNDYLEQAMQILQTHILNVVVPPDKGYKEELARMDDLAVKTWAEELLSACDTSVKLQDAVQCVQTYVLLSESAEIHPVLQTVIPNASLMILGGSCALRILHYTTIRDCREIFMLSDM